MYDSTSLDLKEGHTTGNVPVAANPTDACLAEDRLELRSSTPGYGLWDPRKNLATECALAAHR